MQNTRLIKFLKSLNNIEIRQFRDFINSPSFNKNKNIVQLFEILYQHYPDFDTQELSEENLFKVIFGTEKFEYFKLKNLISDLFSLGKEFLAFNIYKKNNTIQEKYTLQELRNKNLDVTFEQVYKYAVKSLEKTIVKDENYYFHKLDLQNEIMSFNSPKKPNTNFHYMQERLDLFVNYSLIFLLKIYNIMLHENNQNSYNFDLKMFDNIMEYLKGKDLSGIPIVNIYYNILQMEKTKDEKYFYILKELKNKYREVLNVVDNYMVYLHMDGYCATAYNNFGRTDLLNEQFILAKEHPVSDMTGNGKILYPDFLNQVKKAVRVKEFIWAENFIELYKSKLTDEEENTMNFCYGIISYGKGDLEKALDYFSKTNFSSLILKLQVKILLLQLYYEKEYYDQGLLMIDSFRHFLSREKSILELIKISLMEFLKITGDLIKIKNELHSKDIDFKIEKVKKEIENMTSNRFGIKLWLEEKAKSLAD